MPKKVRLSQTASDHLLTKMYAKGWTEVDLSNKTGLDPRTIGSAIAGKNVNLSTIFRIEEALGIDPSQLIQMDNSREEAALSVTTGKNSIFEKWHPLFCNVLQSRLNLSSNTFTSFDGLCFERRDVYVPLALYKRSSQLNHKESLAEILNTFLAGGEIKTRMVFCGLPGSGKTTQLQAIADAVSNHPYCGFVIWISPENFLKAPAHLDPLTELLYLLPGHSNLSDTDRGELRTLLSQSLVCLILDDVGEIETRDSRDNQDLQDYFNRLNQRVLKLSSIAHFVMSCRTAVWDDMGNCLRESFDTYDMVGFSVGEGKDLGQLGQGIDKLFPVKVAKHLRESLEFYPHFKFLLSLPLHLISLRYAWHLCGDSDELSILSAELHSKFVDRLCDRCRIPEDERLHISHNAGDLAHFAIERSRRSLQFSKKAIYEDSWKGRARLNSFDELIEVGILRKFGMSYRTPNEEIYVFFYPFLQMYFAAAAVFFMSWLFFFNPNPEDPEKKSFRAQELPWWEAILIWLSRKDVEDTYKEALLNALMDFEDECGGFYYFRSYCLIAAAIQQYPSFSRREEVLHQILAWSLGQSGVRNLGSKVLPLPDRVRHQAAKMLLVFDPNEVKRHIQIAVKDEESRARITNFIYQSQFIDSPLTQFFNRKHWKKQQRYPEFRFMLAELDILIDELEQATTKKRVKKVERLLDQILDLVIEIEHDVLPSPLWDDQLKLLRVIKKWFDPATFEEDWMVEVQVKRSKLDRALNWFSEELPYIAFRDAWQRGDSPLDSLF